MCLLMGKGPGDLFIVLPPPPFSTAVLKDNALLCMLPPPPPPPTQALRIGATEPALQAKLQQQLKPLAVVKTLTNAAGTAVGAAIGTTTITSSSSSGRPQLREASSSRGVDDVLQRAGDVVDADDEVVRQQQELADFDRRLQELSTGKDE